MSLLRRQPFSLNGWRIDPIAFEATRSGETVRLEPKAIDVLVTLAEHAGEVVSRDDLLAAVWPDVVVTDASLTRCVSQLRQALDDDPKAPALIETIPKAGYRLLAPPVAAPPHEPDPPPARSRPRWLGVLAAAALAVALVVSTFHLRTGPRADEILYRIDLSGTLGDAVVTYTGPEGNVVARTPGFPFEATVETAGEGLYRIEVRGRTANARLRLHIASRGDGRIIDETETTSTVSGSPQSAFVYAQLQIGD